MRTKIVQGSILALVFMFMLIMSSCSREPVSATNQSAGLPVYDTNLSKAGNQGNRSSVGEMIYNANGGSLKIDGRNINGGKFKIEKKNFTTDSLYMTLTKKNQVSNRYVLKPKNLSLPQGVNITLDYDHSALPLNVNENDLQVFQKENGGFIGLRSRVNTRKMQVSAMGFSTGKYVLGAYATDGSFNIIEGEFGLRNEKTIRAGKKGKVTLGGGSYLEVPKGALNETTTIGIIATRETIRGISDSKMFTFTPHGTVFNKPVKLVMSWAELAGQSIQLLYFNEATGEWEQSGEGVWDYTNQTVTIYLYHFSRYAMAYGG